MWSGVRLVWSSDVGWRGLGLGMEMVVWCGVWVHREAEGCDTAPTRIYWMVLASDSTNTNILTLTIKSG